MSGDSPTLASSLSALGSMPPSELSQARLPLHFATQPVAAFGFTVLPAEDDFSHSALRWSHEEQALVSNLHRGTGLFAGLHVAEFVLALHRGDEEVERLDLEGQTLADCYHWLGEALTRAGLRAPKGVVRPGHGRDMPKHPVATGEPFVAPDPAARQELARWLEAADALLRQVVDELPGMSEIGCWPHHFDTASMHVLGGAGDSMRSVGVGLSPGDRSYQQPYIYVTPWPHPKGELPELTGGGAWHTKGWTGAVLTAEELLAVEGGEARAQRIMDFVRASHATGIKLVTKAGSKK